MLSDAPTLDEFVSSSPAMQRLLATATRVAASDVSVLVLGETGVGKERLARAMHAASPRANGPFVAVNCGAIPEGLLESELFGHERGAFTGAVRVHRGHFELAHGGTFFLDEVGDLPLQLQVKLLRVLQDHQVQRVGAERSAAVDVRVIAATSQNLDRAMADKRFRQDLFYRLGVVTLVLPPLRARREDIPALADAFRAQVAARLGRPHVAMSDEALDVLLAHDWPGNVRELASVIERAVVLGAGDVIEAADLSDLTATQPSRVHVWNEQGAQPDALLEPGWVDMPWHLARQEALAAFERRYLTHVLSVSQGKIGDAAKRAGINPRSLYEKMQRYDLHRDRFQPLRSLPQGRVQASGPRAAGAVTTTVRRTAP